MRRRLGPLPLAIAVAALAFVWFGRVSPPVFPINDDAIRDQLLVRDCTDLGFCHLLGAPSSFGGIHHGAVWIDLLTAVRWLGGDLAAQRIVVLAGMALSVSTLFIVVWQWLRPRLALPAAVLLIVALTFDMPASLLINPSVAVFPDVLTIAGLLCYGLSRQRRFLLLAAFALGVATSMHTASLSLLVPFLIIVAVTRGRVWRELIPAVAMAGFVYAIPSSATLRANVLALAEHGRLLPILAAGLVAVLIATALGPRFRRLAWGGRVWTIVAIMIVPFAMMLSWMLIVERHHFSFIYLHPILAPGAVATAALIAWPFERLARYARPLGWIPTAAAAALLAIMTFNALGPVALAPIGLHAWHVHETDVVADEAARRGWSYEDLVFHLQGNGCRALLAGISAAAPAPGMRSNRGRRHLQVVKAPRDAFGSYGDLVPLGANAAYIREVESWLQPESLKSCRVPLASGAPALCTTALAPDAHARAPVLFIARSFPLIENLAAPARPYIATYEIPLAPVAGERRDLTLADDHTSPCGWRITRIDGVRVEGSLPARRVRLHAAGAGTGLVVFEKPFGTEGCPSGELDTHYPPCVLETAPDDPLQELVGRP